MKAAIIAGAAGRGFVTANALAFLDLPAFPDTPAPPRFAGVHEPEAPASDTGRARLPPSRIGLIPRSEGLLGVSKSLAVLAVQGSLQLGPRAGERERDAVGQQLHFLGDEDAGVGAAVGATGIAVRRNLAAQLLQHRHKLADVIGLHQ